MTLEQLWNLPLVIRLHLDRTPTTIQTKTIADGTVFFSDGNTGYVQYKKDHGWVIVNGTRTPEGV